MHSKEGVAEATRHTTRRDSPQAGAQISSEPSYPKTTGQMDFKIPESVLRDPIAMGKLLSGVKAHMGMLDGQIAIYQKQAYHNKMQANMMKELYDSLTKKLEKVEES